MPKDLKFRVHAVIDGKSHTITVEAKTPNHAQQTLRDMFPGSKIRVTKVKVDRS